MVLVAVLTPVTGLGLLAAVVIFLPSRFLAGLVIALGIGVVARAMVHHSRKPAPDKVLAPEDDPELFAILDRMCLLAGLLRPELVLRNERQPNSWVVHLPGRTPRLYVTTGLRELLSIDELTAVLAHELAHVANRDALVMSVVGMPGSIMLGARGGGVDGVLVALIGLLASVGTRILSRYRELAADAGSATITGRPSALAAALLKVSDSLVQVPAKDLRAAARLNAFNLVAIQAQPGKWGPQIPLLRRLSSTHPPLQARLDALNELERGLHTRVSG
ncbi:MAG TPA: M48 family metalloprotease [Solirubrobacteraceae bacterium]|jgi:heat shock protein HtpX|nr:M48 family metalloprotease [Solirubrobacteraceae bacterium]